MSTLSHVWTVCSLLAILAQFGMIRGFNHGLILLVVVPTAIAFRISMTKLASRGRLLANIFLTLIGLGILVAQVPRLFPDFGGVDRNLPPQSDRVLTWYCAVYLVFISVVIPFHVFTQALEQHRAGQPAQFSPVTCVLGMVTATIMLPGTAGVILHILHLFPFFR